MKSHGDKISESRDRMEEQDFVTVDFDGRRYGFFVRVPQGEKDKEILEDIVADYDGLKIKYDEDFRGVDNPFQTTGAQVYLGP